MRDYIAVDWGSTQLRGWLIRNGQCVETKQLPLGITRLNGRSPADVFAEHVAPWRGAEMLPVLLEELKSASLPARQRRERGVKERNLRTRPLPASPWGSPEGTLARQVAGFQSCPAPAFSSKQTREGARTRTGTSFHKPR